MFDTLEEAELTKKIGNRYKVDYTGHGNILVIVLEKQTKGNI